MKNQDMADICELAHEFTVRECEANSYPYEEEAPNGDIRYPEKAQEVFDYYYDQITNILNV